MKRINVVGTSGSGKSTFSRQLALQLNIPHYEMDAMYWKTEWAESSDEEFFAKVENVTQGPTWILDGNYNRTVPIKWAQVDTVVWIDYSFPRTLYQALTRALLRCISGKELWPDTGNKESFVKSFLSRDSVLLWTLKTYRSNIKRYESMMTNPKFSHIRFVRITSPRQAKAFIQQQVKPDEAKVSHC